MQRRRFGRPAERSRLRARQPVHVRATQRQALRRFHRRARGARERSRRHAPVEVGAEGRRDDRPDRGRAQQAGHARDGVVDARGDSRLVLGARQHRRRERRHGHSEPEREHEQAWQDFGHIPGPQTHQLK